MGTESPTLVLGLGSSGEAAVRLLLAEGKAVCAVDGGSDAKLETRAQALRAEGAEVRLGQRELPAGRFSAGVVSPGVPLDSPWIREARARGIPIQSELELGWSRARCRVLAITGSCGKSTLVKLCAETLKAAGLKAAIGGNYGPPICRVVRESGVLDWLVIEVSSFQLETVERFRPDIGILLNLYPNHLDRHGDWATYAAMKARLFSAMTGRDCGILHDETGETVRALARSGNRWITFGSSPSAMVRYADQTLWRSPAKPGEARQSPARPGEAPRSPARPGEAPRSQAEPIMRLDGTLFSNAVLGMTAAAAAAAMEAAGVPLKALETAMRGFERLPHRLQEVGTVRGVRFVDDSKATNLAATMGALNMTAAPVRLIAGGLPKNEPYEPARDLLACKASGVYLIGKAAETMAAAWKETVPCHLCGELGRALEKAWGDAQSGDTILLSPACASFDQFSDYGERGNRFARWVKENAKEEMNA